MGRGLSDHQLRSHRKGVEKRRQDREREAARKAGLAPPPAQPQPRRAGAPVRGKVRDWADYAGLEDEE